jgi:hypothetical protein
MRKYKKYIKNAAVFFQSSINIFAGLSSADAIIPTIKGLRINLGFVFLSRIRLGSVSDSQQSQQVGYGRLQDIDDRKL